MRKYVIVAATALMLASGGVAWPTATPPRPPMAQVPIGRSL